jgi:hypothetical protein
MLLRAMDCLAAAFAEDLNRVGSLVGLYIPRQNENGSDGGSEVVDEDAILCVVDAKLAYLKWLSLTKSVAMASVTRSNRFSKYLKAGEAPSVATARIAKDSDEVVLPTEYSFMSANAFVAFGSVRVFLKFTNIILRGRFFEHL